MSEVEGLPVLVVEDNADERLLLTRLLEARGHTITACDSGEAALDAFRAARHPLVILDLGLPGMGGLEVCESIRGEPGGKQTVILVVTADETAEALESVLAIGANDYISKPIDLGLLNVRFAVAERAVHLEQERVRTRAELESTTRELTMLFESLPDVFFSVDLEAGRLIQVSQAAQRLFGRSAEELAANEEAWRSLLYPAGLENVERAMLELPPGASLTRQYQVDGPHGREMWIASKLKPHIVDGRVVRIDGFASDFTAQHLAQDELAIRNRELSTLFRMSEITIRAERMETAIQGLLTELSEVTGFPVITIEEYSEDRQAMIVAASRGLPFSENGEPVAIPLNDTLATKAVQTGTTVLAEGPGAREHAVDLFHDMKLRTFMAVPMIVGKRIAGVITLSHPESIRPEPRTIRWLEGLTNTVAAFIERMRADDAMRESEASYRSLAEELQSANKELEGFSYSLAHDLRAPLRTMTGFAHALVEQHGDDLDEQAGDYVQRIIASGRRAETLISDLLAYSRLSFEELEVQEVELSEVFEAVTENLQGDISARNATVEIERPLPTVMGVHTILVQVMSNLVSNAIKFVPLEREPEVRIHAESKDGWTRVWVTDNGVGVPEGQEERIFRTFERLSDSQSVPGTGIGLAIVRRGIERIGGAAGIERRDSGSAFWVDLAESGNTEWQHWAKRR